MTGTGDTGATAGREFDGVELREDPDLTRELTERLLRTSDVRSVGVTDLLALRRAFWRRVGPPPEIEVARRERQAAGAAFHRRLAPIFASEGQLEVRVRRDGISGRIDVLAEVPIEVKTGATLVRANELRTARPDHLEQLGMYCSLIGRPRGRLVSWVEPAGGAASISVADVGYRSLPHIREEMLRRASDLRAAWDAERTDALPRCPWFSRGCEFQTSRICDCTGTEASHPSRILDELESIEARSDLEGELAKRRAASPTAASGPVVGKFRELVFPRRAYFERVSPVEVPPAPTRPSGPDLFSRLLEAVESGPIGEVATLPPRAEEPEEEVAGFRGLPYLVKTSRARDPLPVERWLDRLPQYALELGFRCAVTGTSSGRIVLGQEHARSDRERLRVVEYSFRPMTRMARLCRERADALRRAQDRGDPSGLAPCPRWMFEECPYRDRCGCDPSRPTGPT